MRRPLFMDFIDCANGTKKHHNSLLRSGVAEFGALVRDKAERFVLSDETANCVQDMTTASLKRLEKNTFLKYRDIIRPPYQNTWVEMPLTPYVREQRTKTTGSCTRQVTDIGMFISDKLNDRVFTLTAAWRFDDGKFDMAYYTTIVQLEDEYMDYSSFEMNQMVRLHTTSAEVDHHMKAEDLDETLRRMTWVPNPFAIMNLGKTPEEMVANFRLNEARVYEQGGDLFREAVEENENLFGAWMLMLNARSGVARKATSFDVTRPGISFGNKKKPARVRRNPFTVISMTDYEYPDGTPRESFVHRAKHLVRGHFKQRKTGMFWWNPYMRGHGDYTPREAYICT